MPREPRNIGASVRAQLLERVSRIMLPDGLLIAEFDGFPVPLPGVL